MSPIFSADDADDVDAARTTPRRSTTGPTAGVPRPTPPSAPTPCPPADGSAERDHHLRAAPPACIDPAKTYTATVATTEGDIIVDLDPEPAPTVNNFVFLARYHYYDGVAFHRIIPDFMVQGGDPTGDRPARRPRLHVRGRAAHRRAASYELGTLAMANSGPDTNGSQFFIVTGTGRRPARRTTPCSAR